MTGVEGSFGSPGNEPAPVDPTLHGYALREIDRGATRLNATYRVLDGMGPVGRLAALCEQPGRVVVLDGGCGTGRQLHDTIQYVRSWYARSIKDVDGHGISNFNFLGRSRFTAVNEAFAPGGRLAYYVADLAVDPLTPGLYDLIYSDEVLVHSDDPDPIVLNFWHGLKEGGDMYFNILERQGFSLERGALANIRRQGGTVLGMPSPPLTVEALAEEADPNAYTLPRWVYRITKPDRSWFDELFKTL
jgi:SAM-dependent methyltransferase